MSNIHGFHNLGPPRPAQPQGQSSQRTSRYQPQQVQRTSTGLPGGEEEDGISMMMPKMRPDGAQPELSERIFPGIAWKTMTTFVSLIDLTLFIIELIVGGAKFDGAFVSTNKMGGPSAVTLCNMGGKWEPSIRHGDVWRLFTAILLHAGVLHIASNLFFQLRFGYVTEARWGAARWTGIYVLTGIMASLWSTQLGPTNVSVGASGALFGLVGADMAYLAYNWVAIPHNRQEAFLLVIVTVITFLFGIDGNIDNYAHLGGLIGGLCLGFAIPPALVERPQAKLIRVVGATLYAGLFLLFVLLIFVGNPWKSYHGSPACPTA